MYLLHASYLDGTKVRRQKSKYCTNGDALIPLELKGEKKRDTIKSWQPALIGNPSLIAPIFNNKTAYEVRREKKKREKTWETLTEVIRQRIRKNSGIPVRVPCEISERSINQKPAEQKKGKPCPKAMLQPPTLVVVRLPFPLMAALDLPSPDRSNQVWPPLSCPREKNTRKHGKAHTTMDVVSISLYLSLYVQTTIVYNLHPRVSS